MKNDPATRHKTFVGIDHEGDEVVTITVGEGRTGFFFKIFSAVVESGRWARLSPSAAKVLVVLAHAVNAERRSEGGTWLAWPSVAKIMQRAGTKQSQTYVAIAELERAGLLCRRTTGGGRASTTYQILEPTPVRGTLPLRPTGIDPSDPSGPPEGTPPAHRTRLRLNDPDRNNNNSDNASTTNTPDVAVVVLLRGQGFAQKDAEAIAATPQATPDQVATAIANADVLEAAGKLASRAGYIRKAIAEGYAPVPAVAKRKAAERRRQREAERDATAAAEKQAERQQQQAHADALDALDDDQLAELVRLVADEQDTRTRRRWLAVPDPRKHARLRAAVLERISDED